jgi:hypothetical protein
MTGRRGRKPEPTMAVLHSRKPPLRASSLPPRLGVGASRSTPPAHLIIPGDKTRDRRRDIPASLSRVLPSTYRTPHSPSSISRHTSKRSQLGIPLKFPHARTHKKKREKKIPHNVSRVRHHDRSSGKPAPAPTTGSNKPRSLAPSTRAGGGGGMQGCGNRVIQTEGGGSRVLVINTKRRPGVVPPLCPVSSPVHTSPRHAHDGTYMLRATTETCVHGAGWHAPHRFIPPQSQSRRKAKKKQRKHNHTHTPPARKKKIC